MNNTDLLIPASLDRHRVLAGFTTRRGGISRPPFDSLNLGTGGGDDPDTVEENYRILCRHLGVSRERTALMRQVHSATVRVVDEGGVIDDADGLLTAVPGILLGVRVADCVPAIIFDPTRHVAGVVHCGWKPIVGSILEKTLGIMRETWGCDPGNILAVLGPSAAGCCYEVGPEVAGRLSSRSVIKRDGRLFADLHTEIMERLNTSGIPEARIERFSRCTICNPDDFFSYRRDGKKSGRLMGYVMIRENI